MNSHRIPDDHYFIDLAKKAAAFSPDPHTKVGAVIANELGRIVVYGCNDFPFRLQSTPERLERPLKYKYLEHAERMAIYTAAAAGRPISGCSMFIHGLPPCAECARGIIQSGIRRVVFLNVEIKEDQINWKEDLELAKKLLIEAKIDVTTY